MTIFLRGYNWLRRFRHRCGYGVHSPSDFHFITFVVYEKLPYYAYSYLHHLRRVVASFPHHREKVDKFLFRMVNYLQPAKIVEVGTGSGLSALYMSSASRKCEVSTWDTTIHPKVAKLFSQIHNVSYHCLETETEWKTLLAPNVSMVHIGHTHHYAEVFEALLPYVDDNSCVVISFPYANKEKKKWWNDVVKSNRTGVTFDLYDLGIVFFNKGRIKEHRIVNFL